MHILYIFNYKSLFGMSDMLLHVLYPNTIYMLAMLYFVDLCACLFYLFKNNVFFCNHCTAMV